MKGLEDVTSESLRAAITNYINALNVLRSEYKKSDYYDPQDPSVCSSAEKILQKILPHPNFID